MFSGAPVGLLSSVGSHYTNLKNSIGLNNLKNEFRKVLPCLGFTRQNNAKRSLSMNFKEGVDFKVLINEEVDNELPGLSEDYGQRAEIIMLTFRCALKFFSKAPKHTLFHLMKFGSSWNIMTIIRQNVHY